MTGYTVHTGSSVKFSDGWDNIFGGTSGKQTKRSAKKSKKAAAARKTTPAKKRVKAQRSGRGR